jgi:hypothetical protein
VGVGVGVGVGVHAYIHTYLTRPISERGFSGEPSLPSIFESKEEKNKKKCVSRKLAVFDEIDWVNTVNRARSGKEAPLK